MSQIYLIFKSAISLGQSLDIFWASIFSSLNWIGMKIKWANKAECLLDGKPSLKMNGHYFPLCWNCGGCWAGVIVFCMWDEDESLGARGQAVVGRKMAPKDIVNILSFGKCACVALHGKRDFAGMIKLRILRWGNYLGISGCAQWNRRVFLRARQECQSQTCWKILHYWLKMEEVVMSHGTQEASRSWKSQGNGLSPRPSRKNATLPTLRF